MRFFNFPIWQVCHLFVTTNQDSLFRDCAIEPFNLQDPRSGLHRCLILYSRNPCRSTTSTMPSPKSKSGRRFTPPAFAFRQAYSYRLCSGLSGPPSHVK